MLEAYQGTYQQLSPMALAPRGKDEDDLSDLELSAPAPSRGVSFGKEKGGKPDKLAQDAQKKKKKSVSVYDEDGDAQKISEALGRHRGPDTTVISDILPFLSHDNVVYLRRSYKKQVKVQGKGVNLAKHLKTKLDGNLSKVAYVTALGRWESEGYWANFWYQSHSSRRELLIESLMGRTNADIWNIKDEFRDKKYADNLVTCMERELKPDKFRSAVLMVLEERRQEEQDAYPPEYRNKDVEMLYKAISAPKGGESTMLEIIVRRSDSHLREVLKVYEKVYGENLARAALRKSSNLVVSPTTPPFPSRTASSSHPRAQLTLFSPARQGEVIAHILNGVINKPARDALLLHHAIADISSRSSDELRYELLISRLVRLHWDKAHLRRVKQEYQAKYRVRLQDDIDSATQGPFNEFCYNLCKADQQV